MACPMRGYGCAGTQNDRLEEAVILSTDTACVLHRLYIGIADGISYTRVWTCRYSKKNLPLSVILRAHLYTCIYACAHGRTSPRQSKGAHMEICERLSACAVPECTNHIYIASYGLYSYGCTRMYQP